MNIYALSTKTNIFANAKSYNEFFMLLYVCFTIKWTTNQQQQQQKKQKCFIYMDGIIRRNLMGELKFVLLAVMVECTPCTCFTFNFSIPAICFRYAVVTYTFSVLHFLSTHFYFYSFTYKWSLFVAPPLFLHVSWRESIISFIFTGISYMAYRIVYLSIYSV